MSRPKKSVPSYLHHKASGQAHCVVRHLDGTREQVYLSPYDSEESRVALAVSSPATSRHRRPTAPTRR
jgi:hypothetical protein